MYTDSQHGLTIDIGGPDGNAYVLMGYAKTYAKQLDKDGKAIIEQMMAGNYENLLDVFEQEFGAVITLIGR